MDNFQIDNQDILTSASRMGELSYHNAFMEDLQDIISSNKSPCSTLLLVEISNASILISIYGSKFFDEMALNIKQGISELLSEDSLIYRIGKEYIAIVIPHQDDETLNKYTREIQDYLKLFDDSTDDKPIHIMSAIGSIILDSNTTSALDALEKCYIVLKASDQDVPKNYHSYNEIQEQKQTFKNKLILAHLLKASLTEKKIRLAFQPIINSSTGKISYYESLLRIINNDGKIISAGPFIPIAEEMEFINLVDELVLEMVAEELRSSSNITLAFNLSSLGVHNSKWLAKAKKIFSDSSLASRAIVEITETAAQRDLGKTAYFVATLQEMGCQVALDDFGSGHTSFRQLKALPVDIIKIDGSFIRDIVSNSDNLMFVKALISMSKGFGFKSVAEFVENGEIAKLLIELQVDYMQGNYFCPAVNHRSWVKET